MPLIINEVSFEHTAGVVVKDPHPVLLVISPLAYIPRTHIHITSHPSWCWYGGSVSRSIDLSTQPSHHIRRRRLLPCMYPSIHLSIHPSIQIYWHNICVQKDWHNIAVLHTYTYIHTYTTCVPSCTSSLPCHRADHIRSDRCIRYLRMEWWDEWLHC